MVWAGFSAQGKLELDFVTGGLGADSYIDLLERRLLPFLENIGRDDLIFQQDNAPAHSAKATKELFLENDVTVLKWPARSADMNPIENVWGILSRDVYVEGKQHDDVEELKEAINYAWERIEMATLKKLATGMPRRLIELLEKKGGETSYA